MKIIKELCPYVIIILVVVLIRTFIATPVRVDQLSMYPTLNPKDILVLNKLDRNFKRFDIVVIKTGDTKIVKRIIGLPGENIEYKDNELYINGEIIEDMTSARTNDFTLKNLYDIDELPQDKYFVMGDNRPNSQDSRSDEIGIIDKKDIIGTVKFRVYPFSRFGIID